MMSLTRWSPLREIEDLHSEMNRLFSSFEGNSKVAQTKGNGSDAGLMRTWSMPLDVAENKDELILKAALPGVDPRNVNIELNDQVLTLTAERQYESESDRNGYHWVEQQYGNFSRTVTLPTYADTEGITAQFNNGVLELRIPKKETARSRRIELQAGNTGQFEATPLPANNQANNAAAAANN